MDLSKVFSPIANRFGSKEEPVEHFLAVKISQHSVSATVWSVEKGSVQIGKVESEKILTNNFDGLLHAVDKAVTNASIDYPDITKVIFAVPLEYAADGNIDHEELTKLRRLCKELDFSPLGYVVVSEALEQYFKETEGAPLSAILVGLDGKKVSITVYKAGKEIGTMTIDKVPSSNLAMPAEIEKALKEFRHIDALPSRIILYDGDSDLSKTANEITAYPWTGRLPFLHFPKVETVSSEFVVKAVSAAGGMQMGGKLTLSDGMESDHTVPVAAAAVAIKEQEQTPEEHLENAVEESSPELMEVSPEEAGFVTEVEPNEAPLVIDEEKQEEKREKVAPFAMFAGIGAFIKSLIPKKKVGSEIETATAKKTRGIPKIVPIGLVLLVLIIGGVAASWYFVPKVNVITTVDSQEFNKDMTVGISNGEEIEGVDETVAASFVEASEIGTKRSVATGEKLVGKKAKGNVTIYSVSEGRSFDEGTVLTSPSGLKFTLTKDVSVASGDAVSAATVTAPVEAANIGDSFNLASGTKFSIGDASQNYLAKNESALTGGESHMATVVTKADQDRLMASLSAELSEKALVDLQAKLDADQQLLPKAVTSTVSKKKFSKDIDAEGDTVSLDLTMDFEGVVFSQDDVIKLFKDKFSSDIPEGYELVNDDASVSVVEAKTDKNENTTLDLQLSAPLVPKTNPSQIASEIAGKNESAATALIKKTPGISDVRYEVTPGFFSPLTSMLLPLRSENINVVIVKN